MQGLRAANASRAGEAASRRRRILAMFAEIRRDLLTMRTVKAMSHRLAMLTRTDLIVPLAQPESSVPARHAKGRIDVPAEAALHVEPRNRRPASPAATARRAIGLWLGALSSGLLAPCLASQCTTQWLPGGGVSGVGGGVGAMAHWDPDGTGPLQSLLVVGGSFRVVGGVLATNIAAFDPASGSWSALGSGLDGPFSFISALATLPSGELVAAGSFTTAGGVAVNNIARWNGSTWAPLGSGLTHTQSPYVRVRALATLPTGELVAAGDFTTAGGVVAHKIARWDGTSWSPLGTGFAGLGDSVVALTTLANGDLAAGGVFASAGGVAANNIARWDGFSWSPIGTGLSGCAGALATRQNGDLVASAGSGIMSWNGTAWSQLGTSTSFGGTASGPGSILELSSLPNGDLIAGGEFWIGSSSNIARWDGSAWVPLGAGVYTGDAGRVWAVTTLTNGDLVAAGDFTIAGSVAADNIARWNGSAWSALIAGMSGPVRALAALPNGTVVAAVQNPGDIQRWDGTSWSTIGTSMLEAVLLTLPNGHVVAGGSFTAAGGVAVGNIARWNGTAWSPIGQGLPGRVTALTRLPNGDLVAGVSSYQGAWQYSCMHWNGTTWSPLGSGMNGDIYCLTPLPNGEVVAGGSFTNAGGVWVNQVARWNGTAWSPLGTGVSGGGSWPGVYALTVLSNGDLVAAGDFTVAAGVAANNIARWNGSSWSPLGTGINGWVAALTTLPNGDLVATGLFTLAGGVAANNIARWNGTTWAPLGGGLSGGNPSGASAVGNALAILPNGTLVAGGDFLTAGGLVSAFVAQFSPTCPASAQPYGTGCIGPGGQLQLTADTNPWSGSTFRVTASGLGPTSLGLVVLSLGQALPGIPLQSLPVPGPGAGCTLDVATLDLLALTAPFGAGEQSFQLPITITPTMPGLAFHMQVAELDLGAGWVGTYTTNALTCTFGTY